MGDGQLFIPKFFCVRHQNMPKYERKKKKHRQGRFAPANTGEVRSSLRVRKLTYGLSGPP